MDPKRSYPKRMRTCIDVRCMLWTYDYNVSMPVAILLEKTGFSCCVLPSPPYIISSPQPFSAVLGFFLILSHPHMQTLSKLTCVYPSSSRGNASSYRGHSFSFSYSKYLHPEINKNMSAVSGINKIFEWKETKFTFLIQLPLEGAVQQKLTLQH